MVMWFSRSRLFIATDQMQFQSLQSSQYLMYCSHESMIGGWIRRRTWRLLMQPWKRSLKFHSRVMHIYLVLMCTLNVCLSHFLGQTLGPWKMLFITVQQNNLEICIKYAVNKYILLLSAIASTYALYLRYIFKWDTIVRHFHTIEDTVAQKTVQMFACFEKTELVWNADII